MPFPDQEFLFGLMEKMISTVWRECVGIALETPLPRLTYAEDERRFGSDKPDMRFELEIEDATEVTRGSEFGVFGGADGVRFLRVPAEFPRSTLDELTEFAKQWGAKGMAYIVYGENGEARSPILKFLGEEEQARFKSAPGTTVLFAADTYELTSRVLGPLRLELANRLGLIDESK